MVSEDANRLWVNGYVVLGAKTRIPIQEVSVDLTRDTKRQYNSGVNKPSSLTPGQERIEFKIKRIFSNTVIVKLYEKRCYFNMVLFNNSSDPGENTQGEKVCALLNCLLTKVSISGLGKGDAVTEDVSGEALDITWDITDIAPLLNPACENL